MTALPTTAPAYPVITLVHFRITVTEPFAVAAPEEADGGVDRPVASDHRGRAIVPPSSVAGSLRAHVARVAPDLVEGLFGPGFGASPLSASRLRVTGTELTLGARPVMRTDLIVRRQTAVDRSRRAARNGTLRSSHLVPAGATVDVYVRVDDDLTDAERDALATWEPVLGWGRNSGHGQARLDEATWGTLDLSTQDGLEAWLLQGGPGLHHTVAKNVLATASTGAAAPWRHYRFAIVDALHVAGEQDADASRSNHTPLWQRPVTPGGDAVPIVEGSTLRGIVRSRCEYILASLPVPTALAEEFVATLFGTADRQGALRFRSSAVDQPTLQTRPHVAIDRVTGGAHDRLLYTYAVVVAGTFNLVIDAYGDLPRAAGTMLDAVVRDLDDGLVGVGGHTASGHGTVRLTDDSPHRPGTDRNVLDAVKEANS